LAFTTFAYLLLLPFRLASFAGIERMDSVAQRRCCFDSYTNG